MAKVKRTVEQIIAKLREAEVALFQGRTVAEVCRSLGVTERTYYRWRKEYGGLKIDQARRLKELEQENTRLRKAAANLTLEKWILRRPPGETSEPCATPAVCGRRVSRTGRL